MLLRLTPISVKPVSGTARKLRWVFSLVLVAMLIGLYISDNKILVGISGLGLTAIFIWSFYQRLTNKNVPHNMRSRSWILVFIIIAILFATWTKLTQ